MRKNKNGIRLDILFLFVTSIQFYLFYRIKTKLNNLKYISFQIIFSIFNYFCVFFVFSNQIQFNFFFSFSRTF